MKMTRPTKAPRNIIAMNSDNFMGVDRSKVDQSRERFSVVRLWFSGGLKDLPGASADPDPSTGSVLTRTDPQILPPNETDTTGPGR